VQFGCQHLSVPTKLLLIAGSSRPGQDRLAASFVSRGGCGWPRLGGSNSFFFRRNSFTSGVPEDGHSGVKPEGEVSSGLKLTPGTRSQMMTGFCKVTQRIRYERAPLSFLFSLPHNGQRYCINEAETATLVEKERKNHVNKELELVADLIKEEIEVKPP